MAAPPPWKASVAHGESLRGPFQLLSPRIAYPEMPDPLQDPISLKSMLCEDTEASGYSKDGQSDTSPAMWEPQKDSMGLG